MSLHNIQDQLSRGAFTGTFSGLKSAAGYHFGFGQTVGNGIEGWAPGALFVDNDASAGAQLNINTGTAATATWVFIPSNALNLSGIAATAAEINAAADVSARRVAVADADYSILAANSGRPHLVANVSADRTFTFPAEADGLEFEFYAQVAAADGHDWIFDTGSNTNYFLGGVVFLDSDAADTGDEVSTVGSDLNSNSKFQINLPDAGTYLKFICDGTLWTVSGMVISTTAPAFADQ